MHCTTVTCSNDPLLASRLHLRVWQVVPWSKAARRWRPHGSQRVRSNDASDVRDRKCLTASIMQTIKDAKHLTEVANVSLDQADRKWYCFVVFTATKTGIPWSIPTLRQQIRVGADSLSRHFIPDLEQHIKLIPSMTLQRAYDSQSGIINIWYATTSIHVFQFHQLYHTFGLPVIAQYSQATWGPLFSELRKSNRSKRTEWILQIGWSPDAGWSLNAASWEKILPILF